MGLQLKINVLFCHDNVSEEKIAGAMITFAGFQEYSEEVVQRNDTRGEKYYWVGGTYSGHKDIEGSDGNAVAQNYISINLQDLSGKTITNLKPLESLLKDLNEDNEILPSIIEI